MQQKCFNETEFSQLFNFAFFVLLFHSVKVYQKQPSKKCFSKSDMIKYIMELVFSKPANLEVFFQKWTPSRICSMELTKIFLSTCFVEYMRENNLSIVLHKFAMKWPLQTKSSKSFTLVSIEIFKNYICK